MQLLEQRRDECVGCGRSRKAKSQPDDIATVRTLRVHFRVRVNDLLTQSTAGVAYVATLRRADGDYQPAALYSIATL